MEDERRIPIIVGVTGHRALRPEDAPLLRARVTEELEKLRDLCPNSPLYMLTSLAEGADLLCAAAADALGIPLIAALPMPQADYRADFSAAAAAQLDALCAKASEVFVVPDVEPAPPAGADRDFRFRQAGIYVAEHSHVLLALWDGGSGTPAACGTAETVGFALRGEYSPAEGLPLRSGRNEAVVHISAPRAGQDGDAGTVEILGDRETVRAILARTDEFNRGAAGTDTGARTLVPARGLGDRALYRMERIGLAAGRLSAAAAERFRRALALLAVCATLLTLAFLLYDEAQTIWMILVCGGMLAAGFACQRYAARSDCHRNYIEYRALAECLRAQVYLRYAGSAAACARLSTWSQRDETAWVLAALCALTVGPPPREAHDIRACWVEGQRRYHEAAGKKAQKRTAGSERVVRAALIVSVALYLAAVAYELACGGLSAHPAADAETWRTVLKIVLGAISALTLFISGYYGRLSLPRVGADHDKMARFYARMDDLLARQGQTEALLRALAREELIENGNWTSYQRDNKPEISF